MFPDVRGSARPSLAPLVILLASLLLALLLALISWRNYQHEQKLRERSLTQQGATLILSFEAGARTGMMMRWNKDALRTLVEETVRETEVAYIAIVDDTGKLFAAGGSWAEGMKLPLGSAFTSAEPLHRFTSDRMGKRVFEVSRQFRPRWNNRRHRQMMGMMGRGNDDWEEGDADFSPPPKQAIFVGLYLGEFEQARLDSLRQNILLGGLLLLVGSAGFYLLFLSQRNRVTRATLERMELYTASLIDGMPAGLLSLDADMRVIAANPRTLEMLGYPQKDVVGRQLKSLIPDDELLKRLENEQRLVEVPASWKSANGDALPLKISASRLAGSDGEPLGTVLILRDMREIQAMEEQLERSRRHSALGVMATGVAHEIRNPLGTLRGFAQYFQRSSGDDQAREYAGLMISEVDRLNRVISALLQFSRPREPEPVLIEPAEICQRLEALMRDEAKANDIALQFDYRSAEPFCADFDLLLQTLLNLVQNGIDACSKGCQVQLTLRSLKGQLEIEVADDGPGIGDEERQKIFDPFYSTRKTGTGLGLAIVSQIVEQHGGEISVDSNPTGGTRFLIRLPQEET